MLHPEAGETLLAALAPLSAPAEPDDLRTAGQRRADALGELCHRSLDDGQQPVHGGERPHLTIVAPLDALAGPAPRAAWPGQVSAETTWGAVLGPEATRRIACDASLTRVLLDADSQPLDVGRRTRLVPAAIRTALAVRDRGCAFPGCDRPPPWTDAHHLRHWADGGPTSLDKVTTE